MPTLLDLGFLPVLPRHEDDHLAPKTPQKRRQQMQQLGRIFFGGLPAASGCQPEWDPNKSGDGPGDGPGDIAQVQAQTIFSFILV